VRTKYAWTILATIDFAEKDADCEAAVREGLKEAGEYWAAHMRAPHFEKDARSRYGYLPRHVDTMRRKRAVLARGFIRQRIYKTKLFAVIPVDYHIMYDLNWTGRTRREFTTNAPAFRTTRKAIEVRVKVPPYVNARRGTAPNKRAELTSLSDEEKKILTEIVGRRLREFLNKRRTLRAWNPQAMDEAAG
jgi:hypothetical protein